MALSKYILWFDEINLTHLPQVGGKNSSLGEMITLLSDSNVSVPGGFATTSDAFWFLIQQNNLDKKRNNI